jgi:hypothetical protein
MAASCILGDTYGVLEAEKLPEVFHIEDVLDFSCEDIGGPIDAGDLQLSGVTEESCGEGSITSLMEVKSELLEPSLEDFEVHTDLCVPCDDLADLQWLSSFVEDSFAAVELPGASSTYGGFSSPARNSEHTANLMLCDAYQPYQRSSPVSVLENSSATSSELTGSDYRDISVPGRARSKRSRTGARTWTSKILPTSSSVSSFESMGDDSYTTSYSPIVSEDSVVDGGEQDDEDSQSSKRSKVTNSSPNTSSVSHVSNGSSTKGRKKSQDNAQAWRCMHCQTQKTPQWRTGPMGPKTLCNACGVRYKSGRLLPEYRPASSPTYVASEHSHSHKKVLEMRREREGYGADQSHGNLHAATPLREKTNISQLMRRPSLENANSEFRNFESAMQKCFVKPPSAPVETQEVVVCEQQNP